MSRNIQRNIASNRFKKRTGGGLCEDTFKIKRKKQTRGQRLSLFQWLVFIFCKYIAARRSYKSYFPPYQPSHPGPTFVRDAKTASTTTFMTASGPKKTDFTTIGDRPVPVKEITRQPQKTTSSTERVFNKTARTKAKTTRFSGNDLATTETRPTLGQEKSHQKSSKRLRTEDIPSKNNHIALLNPLVKTSRPPSTGQALGDGNCFFNSIAMLVAATEGRRLDPAHPDITRAARVLRARAVEQMRRDPGTYFPTYGQKEVAESIRKVEQGIWAGQQEIIALADVTGIPITVQTVPQYHAIAQTYPPRNAHGNLPNPLTVWFTGGHYEPIYGV